MASFAKNSLAEQLLTGIDSVKLVDHQTGKVSFKVGFDFETSHRLLEDLLALNSSIPDTELHRIVWQSMVASAKSGKITVQSFLAEAGRLEHQYLSCRPKRFVLLTQVSLSNFDKIAGARFSGGTISFPKSIPKAFSMARRAILIDAQHSLHTKAPANYRWVRVGVTEKSEAAAVELALKALHLLLGLWNLWLNKGTGFRRTFKGPRKPVNSISLGPIHTVHSPSGKIEREVWWYEPNYFAPIIPKSLGSDFQGMCRFASVMRSRLRRIQYHEKLEGIIRYYNRALDEHDWSTSFIRLWQALEVATHTINEPYSVTVRRTSFIYKDWQLRGNVLEHLREYRNKLVHFGDESESIESNLYLLKGYVEDMLMFHLNEGPRFSSMTEFAQFVNLPADEQAFKKQFRLMQIARTLRNHVARAEKTLAADAKKPRA